MPVITGGRVVEGCYGPYFVAGVPDANNPKAPARGAVAIDILTGKMYSNTGTAAAPTWGLTGAQT